jgi:hypothetical protein
MFQKNVEEKIKTHILCLVTFVPKNRAVYEIMWKKYCRVGQATDDSMTSAHCMLDT